MNTDPTPPDQAPRADTRGLTDPQSLSDAIEDVWREIDNLKATRTRIAGVLRRYVEDPHRIPNLEALLALNAELNPGSDHARR